MQSLAARQQSVQRLQFGEVNQLVHVRGRELPHAGKLNQAQAEVLKPEPAQPLLLRARHGVAEGDVHVQDDLAAMLAVQPPGHAAAARPSQRATGPGRGSRTGSVPRPKPTRGCPRRGRAARAWAPDWPWVPEGLWLFLPCHAPLDCIIHHPQRTTKATTEWTQMDADGHGMDTDGHRLTRRTANRRQKSKSLYFFFILFSFCYLFSTPQGPMAGRAPGPQYRRSRTAPALDCATGEWRAAARRPGRGA